MHLLVALGWGLSPVPSRHRAPCSHRDMQVGLVSHLQNGLSSGSCHGECWPRRVPAHSVWGRRQERVSSNATRPHGHVRAAPWRDGSYYHFHKFRAYSGKDVGEDKSSIQYPVLPHSGEEAFQKVISAKPPH